MNTLCETDSGSFLCLDFLFNEKLLNDQLKNSSDVSFAASLISRFIFEANLNMTILKNTSNSECLVYTDNERITCLKLLALKAASFPSWNIDYLKKYVPANVTHTLLEYLVKLTSCESQFGTSSQSLNVDELDPSYLFSLNFYHSWSLMFIVEESFPSKPPKYPRLQLPGLWDYSYEPPATKESILKILLENESISVDVLQKISTIKNASCKMPVADCFNVKLGQEKTNCDWSVCVDVSNDEVICQATYSLGCLNFLRRRYDHAFAAFDQCKSSFCKVSNPVFMKVNMEKVNSYLSACNGFFKVPVDLEPPTLHKKVERYICTNFQNLTDLLVENLIKKELSQSMTDTIEKLVVAAVRQDDLYGEALICCALRKALDGRYHLSQLLECIDCKESLLEFLIKICSYVFVNVSQPQQVWLKDCLVFMTMAIKRPLNLVQKILTSPLKEFFAKSDFDFVHPCLNSARVGDEFPLLIFDEPDVKVKMRNMEQELLLTYDKLKINDIVPDLVRKTSSQDIFQLSDMWLLLKEFYQSTKAIPSHHSILNSLIHTLIAKARLCLRLGLYEESRELLEYAIYKLKDTDRAAPKCLKKFIRPLEWEVLKIDLSMLLNPNTPRADISTEDLVRKAKSCASSIALEADPDLSRNVSKLSTIFLLNRQDWAFFTNVSSKNEFVQFGCVIGSLCGDVTCSRSTQMSAKNFMKYLSSMFSLSPKQGQAGVISDSCFLNFISAIEDETVLSLVTSCLVTILRLVDPNVSDHIFSEYSSLWPSSIDKRTYDRSRILEAVFFVLNRAVTINNENILPIRMLADLHFALKQYRTALVYYIHFGMIDSYFFSKPVAKEIYDGRVISNMIQCSLNISLPAQAAVLCQFYDEVDYSTAFRCLQDKSNASATDFYYSCIWDIAMLECIANKHHKKGEINQFDYVLNLMRQPELNVNSRGRMIPEAIDIRKCIFLRRLAIQFLSRCEVVNFL